MNTISNRNSIPYTSKKIILSRSTDKQKNVNEITNTLYSQIFEGIFKAIAIYPNLYYNHPYQIDRNTKQPITERKGDQNGKQI